jgi:hypothetical protein
MVKTLVIRGKMLDTIQKIGTCPNLPTASHATDFTDRETVGRLTSTNLQWIQEALQLCPGKTYVTGIPFREAVWRTIVLNGSLFEYPAPHDHGSLFETWIHCLEDYPKYLKAIEEYESANIEQPEEIRRWGECLGSGAAKTAVIERVFTKVVIGHRIALTDQGYLGWVPQNSKPGDCVASFEGGYLPFVLRATSVNHASSGNVRQSSNSSPNRWQLIGDCYMHGLMYDVPFKMKEIPSEDIHIV